MPQAVSGTAKALLEPNSRLSGLPTYVFAWLDQLKEAARAKGASLIDLGIGNPDGATPPLVLDAIKKAFDAPSNHGYPPFKGSDCFKEAIARWMERRYRASFDPKTEILALSGSKEGLAHLTMAYLDEGDWSLVPNIYYPVHARATWLMGGQVYDLPLHESAGFLPDLDQIPEEMAQKARLLFINYPNNPTGAVAPLSFYEKAVAFCQKYQIVLVSDLAYGEITYDGYVAPSVFQVKGAKDVAVEFHSFSKSFNMAGCRLGFVVGNPNIVQSIYALRTNMGYGTPTAIQAGGQAALDQAEALIQPIAQNYQNRRDLLIEGFSRLGWTTQPSKGSMYLWLKVPKGFSSEAWVQHVLDQTGVVVSPGHAFGPGGEGYFRLSLVAPEATLNEALQRLEKANIRYSEG